MTDMLADQEVIATSGSEIDVVGDDVLISEYRRVPNWLEHIKQQLDEFLTYPLGWDSYGAAPPDRQIIESARGFLQFLIDECDLPEPYVAPTANGGVFFEWIKGDNELEVDVVTTDAATYSYENTRTGERHSGELFSDDADDGQFLELVRSRIAM